MYTLYMKVFAGKYRMKWMNESKHWNAFLIIPLHHCRVHCTSISKIGHINQTNRTKSWSVESWPMQMQLLPCVPVCLAACIMQNVRMRSISAQLNSNLRKTLVWEQKNAIRSLAGDLVLSSITPPWKGLSFSFVHYIYPFLRMEIFSSFWPISIPIATLIRMLNKKSKIKQWPKIRQ